MRDYDQDPILVYTPYTFDQLKRFQRVHYRKHRAMAIFTMIFAGVVLCLLASNPNRYPEKAILIYFTCLFVVYEGYRALCFNMQFYTPKLYDRYQNAHRGGALYQFMNDHYISTGEDGNFKRVIDSPYDNVPMIVETDGMLYLYTSPTQAQLVDKDGIRNGSTTPEELSAFLREKFKGAKYVRLG